MGLFLSMSCAQAAPLQISSLLKKQVQDLYSYGDSASFQTSNKLVTVYYKSHYSNRKINEMLFYFKDRNLTDQQARGISQLTTRLALSCYNLKPERQTHIQNWIRNWLISDGRATHTSFGPLLLDLQHTEDGEALIWFTRTGVPGKSPWINHCTY